MPGVTGGWREGTRASDYTGAVQPAGEALSPGRRSADKLLGALAKLVSPKNLAYECRAAYSDICDAKSKRLGSASPINERPSVRWLGRGLPRFQPVRQAAVKQTEAEEEP